MPATEDAVDEGWLLLVKAEYTDAQGADKKAIGITDHPVRADVHDDQNNSPDFRNSETTRTVPEDTDVGDPVGPPVVVLTNEDNDRLTYEILTVIGDNTEVVLSRCAVLLDQQRDGTDHGQAGVGFRGPCR